MRKIKWRLFYTYLKLSRRSTVVIVLRSFGSVAVYNGSVIDICRAETMKRKHFLFLFLLPVCALVFQTELVFAANDPGTCPPNCQGKKRDADNKCSLNYSDPTIQENQRNADQALTETEGGRRELRQLCDATRRHYNGLAGVYSRRAEVCNGAIEQCVQQCASCPSERAACEQHRQFASRHQGSANSARGIGSGSAECEDQSRAR